MSDTAKALEKVRGIGVVLAKRLVEAGFDSYEKVAAAGEEELKKIRGINPRAIPAIIAQASTLAAEAPKGREEKVAELKSTASRLKTEVQAAALTAREKFPKKLAGKKGKKVEKEIFRLITALERVEDQTALRVKRAAKALAAVDKKLSGLSEASLKELRKGMKKARKSLKRIVA
jgi:ribosomal protein S13